MMLCLFFEFVVVLIAAGFGTYFGSYLKGKANNLATKEDIADIQKNIEKVKHEFSNKGLRSKNYFEKQVDAYSKLDALLYKYRLYYFSSTHSLDNAENYKKYVEEDICQKLIKISESESLYLSERVDDMIVEFVSMLTNYNNSKESLKKQADYILDFRKILKEDLYD